MCEREQELNKKLAEWRWPNSHICVFVDGIEIDWPTGKGWRIELLTESLDACFKWLVPKAVGSLADTDLSTNIEATYKLFDMWLQEISRSPYKVDYEAMALCLAVEKVIDIEEARK